MKIRSIQLHIVEKRDRNGYWYTWGECDPKRGSQKIAICLSKYFQEVDKRGINNLILYCNSCADQNEQRNEEETK